MPKPNAKPEKFLKLILTLVKTFGWTIPQPRTSNHLPLNLISNSADGSVNGKYEVVKHLQWTLIKKNKKEELQFIKQM